MVAPLLALAAPACFERGDRWLEPPTTTPACEVGTERCTGDALERCAIEGGAATWIVADDCGAQDLVCAEALLACAPCEPDATYCDGDVVTRCSSDGQTKTPLETCDTSQAIACREGSCQNLCLVAAKERSNVGCEYWAVDLDNANIGPTSNAASQQFAVVVSNPQPDVPIRVVIEQDDSLPGELGAPYPIANATIPPLSLEVFKLGPREVDGSPEGEFDTGTHTALTRHAFRITSDFPAVAYQFNPLENVAVFSNDASLLYPREALEQDVSIQSPSYVALGWPQTIAATDDPDTNFSPLDPIHLRMFLTIVATEDATEVRVDPAARVVAGGPVAETQPGGTIQVKLDAFDVLNLETEDFAADFSGSLVYADRPIAVFSGGEAADARHFERLSDRRCCADHLEDQLPPIRTAGKRFAIPHTPNRGRAVSDAGAQISGFEEPDFVRFLAVGEAGATIETTLPPPDDRIVLPGRGAFAEVRVTSDFVATSDAPILVGQIMASQFETAVTKQGLPGGDPSLMMVPPLEQARREYVFLTPDKYAFDFVTIVAPREATTLLDGQILDATSCEVAPADGLTDDARGGPPELVVYRCQLAFPAVDPTVEPPVVTPGVQRDGVHRVVSNAPVFVAITGFDAFVSYAYAAGTDLRDLGVPQ